MTDKQIIIDRLNNIVNLGETENEIYDNLQALLIILNEQGIIDTFSYEYAETKVSKIWGFNNNDR